MINAINSSIPAMRLALNRIEYVFPFLRIFQRTAMKTMQKTSMKIIEMGNGMRLYAISKL